jgi:hypothetical protein
VLHHARAGYLERDVYDHLMATHPDHASWDRARLLASIDTRLAWSRKAGRGSRGRPRFSSSAGATPELGRRWTDHTGGGPFAAPLASLLGDDTRDRRLTRLQRPSSEASSAIPRSAIRKGDNDVARLAIRHQPDGQAYPRH